ncbi:MAG: autotransporter-associated beta strand repeat-containing protein, partial [Vicinamibacteria bacterium]|nr:autotransporter-associated beta strand repeat-containing protein [Vicinamibacteria bacterium]
TISAGILQVGSGGTTGTLGTGAVVNDAALRVNRSDALTVANAISGTGTLTKLGAGTTTLTGTNTYSGTTTISAGILQVGAGGTTGTLGTGAVVANAALVLNRSDALTVANAISGTGTLTQAGAGTTTLTGINTYSGATTISDGTLQLGNGGTTGSIVGDVIDNGVLAFNRSDDVTFSGAISGTGALQQSGPGTLVLTGANSYTGGTTISAGTLQLGNGGTTGSIVGDVIDNGVLVFNRSDTLTFGGAISGTGALLQLGPGLLILTGANTYTGGTTVSGGTLMLGSGGTLGTGGLANNGTLAFNSLTTLVFGGDITGTGALQQFGPGTLVLTGTNTYTGGTTISAGTLQLGNGGTTGSIVGDVTDNGVLAFDRSDTVTFSGTISGTGALRQLGSGTTTLTGSNTYSGGTTISAGTLQLGNGGTTGSIVGDVVDNGVLAFNRSDDLTFGGTISGTGALQQSGRGTLVLTGTSSYTGGTTISAGTLLIGNGGTTGSIVGDVVDNGVLAFNRSDDLTFGGTISGTGALQQSGQGTLVLTGINSYTGGTTISAGTLLIGNEGTTGSIVGDVIDNGVLAFNRSDDLTFNGNISGTGALRQLGSGTTTLTGTSTYTGGTTISAGTLEVGHGGTTGQLGPGQVVDNASLVFNRSNALTVTQAISGTGTVTQAGSGTLTLAGPMTYTGSTLVRAGTLVIDGALAGPVEVAAGATLVVNGDLKVGAAAAHVATFRKEAATADAAASNVATLSVGGDLTLAEGARARVRIDAAGGTSVLATSGVAAIGGATILIDATDGAYGRVTFYPVLHADGGIRGTAEVASTNAALEPWATSTSQTLVVTLLNTALPLASYAATANGGAIGGAFDRLRASASGDLAAVTRELTALDDDGLSRALDAAGGEIHASAVQLAALDGAASTDVIREEIASRGTLEVAGAAPAGWSRSTGRRAWGRAQVQDTTFSADTAHGGRAQIVGLMFGGDWTRADGWLVGIGGGYSTGDLALSGLTESSSYRAPRAFWYGGYAGTRWSVQAGGSLAHTAYDVRRTIAFSARLPEAFGGVPLFGGVNRLATSAPAGVATDVWSSWAHRIRVREWAVRPSTGLRYARYARRAWTERDAGALSLSAPDQTVSSMQADLGVHLARTTGRLRPFAATAARRELTDGLTATTLQLSDTSDGLFVVNGLRLARNNVSARVGFTFQAQALEVSLAYEARHALSQTGQAVQLAVGF